MIAIRKFYYFSFIQSKIPQLIRVWVEQTKRNTLDNYKWSVARNISLFLSVHPHDTQFDYQNNPMNHQNLEHIGSGPLFHVTKIVSIESIQCGPASLSVELKLHMQLHCTQHDCSTSIHYFLSIIDFLSSSIRNLYTWWLTYHKSMT